MCCLPNDKPVTDADVLAAAGRLPERQRLAFFLVGVRQLTVRQAAQAMGVSHPAVMKSLRRARVNLGFDLLEGLNASPSEDCAG
jgi:DNA-directed RNA polymerase specialized sigma24 family protein